MNKLPIILRMMREKDSPFIYSSWLRSYRASPNAAMMSNEVYFDNHKYIIQSILEYAKTHVIIACNKDDEDQIYGFFVYSDEAIHYIYVKYNFRKFGMATKMLEAIGDYPKICTHTCNNWNKISNKFNLDYNPYILYEIINTIGETK